MSTKPFYNLNIESIKENFKEFLRQKPQFQNYNFEAPGIQIFLDQLAYTIFYSLYYANNISNELFMSTVKNRDNALKIADMLNYLPKRKIPASIQVQITNNAGNTLVLPRYSQFTMEDLVLLTDREYTILAGQTETVNLIEGQVNEVIYVADGSDFQEYIVPSGSDVANENVHVWVYAQGQPPQEELIQVNEGTFVSGERNYFLAQKNELIVRFDNGAITRVPVSGENVQIQYVITQGPAVNGLVAEIEPSAQLAITGVNIDIEVPENLALTGGRDEESLEAIQLAAPLFYSTNSRAVTEQDYNNIILRYNQYENYSQFNIWGGDRESVDGNNIVFETEERHLGRVYLSAAHKDYNNPWLNVFDINDIKIFLDKFKIVTLQYVFRQPQMLKIVPDIQVKFRNNLTASPLEVKNAALAYMKTVEGYNASFHPSQLIRFINNLSIVEYCVVDYDTQITIYPENRDVIRIWNSVAPNSISGTVEFGITRTVTDTPISGGFGNISASGIGTIGQIRYSDGLIIINEAYTFTQPYTLSFDVDDKDFVYSERETFLHFDEEFTITVI